MNDQLRLLDLTQVTITAMVEPTGRLGSVKGLWAKLLAAAHEAATIGLVRTVVVAADQSDVPHELEHVTASPLRIVRAATLQDAVTTLHEEHGPRQAVRRHERQQCATLDLLGRPVSLDALYQVLPLLREVKRDRLLRARTDSLEAIDDANTLRGVEVLRWEEELQGERITYESIDLARLFAAFPSIVKDAKHSTPRFVVLGPPGSGKTTLTQYLGWQAANGSLHIGGRRLLPIRVRLRDWETFALPRTGADQHLPFYLTHQHAHLSPAPSPLHWRRWLSNGEVLLLLDGVDEIQGEPAFLNLVATTFATFAECPTVLTCRTVSFERHRTLCPDFPVFTLAGLSAAQQETYIREFPAEHPTDYDPTALLDQLRRSPQLHPLAANPLLLSIICYVADSAAVVHFPTTRGRLYALAIEKLLSTRAQRITTSYPGVLPAPHEKLAILQRAALRLFSQSDRQLTFSGQALGQTLKEALSEEGYGDASAPWANALQADLLRNSGLLRGDAVQGFFFFHLTIQEFLAAAALARHVNDNGWRAPLHLSGHRLSVIELIEKKSWDPRWQEALILLAGQLTEPLPLLTLLTEKRKDDVFRHRLALAVQSLGEMRVELREAFSRLIDEVTESVLSLWLHHAARGTDFVVSHLTHALPVLAQLKGRVEKTPVLHWLRLRLHDVNPDVRAGVLEAFSRMGGSLARETDLLPALTTALQDEDVLVRIKATEALGRVEATPSHMTEVFTALLQAARSDAEWLVRRRARQTLLKLRNELDHVPEELSALLDPQLMRRHSDAPGQVISHSSPRAPLQPGESGAVLISALRAPDAGIRVKALARLKQLGAAGFQHPDLLSTLVEVALHDVDSGVRAGAVEALGHIGPLVLEHPNVLVVIATALRDRDAGVRAWAANALGQFTLPPKVRQEALAALVEALEDADSDVRFAAAEALGRQMGRGIRIFRRWWGKREWKPVEELAAL